MPKYLVRQKLPLGADPVQDHLASVAHVVGPSLDDTKTHPVTWLWGCADLEANEYHMLFEGPDEDTIREYLGDIYGLQSIVRVLFVDPSNIAKMMLRALAEAQPANAQAGGLND